MSAGNNVETVQQQELGCLLYLVRIMNIMTCLLCIQELRKSHHIHHATSSSTAFDHLHGDSWACFMGYPLTKKKEKHKILVGECMVKSWIIMINQWFSTGEMCFSRCFCQGYISMIQAHSSAAKLPRAKRVSQRMGCWRCWESHGGLAQLLVGGLEHQFYFPINIGNNHPNWRTHIFQRGGLTTNQKNCESTASVFHGCFFPIGKSVPPIMFTGFHSPFFWLFVFDQAMIQLTFRSYKIASGTWTVTQTWLGYVGNWYGISL